MGTKLRNFIVQSIAINIPHSFTYMATMHKSILWCLMVISFGISMRSLLTGLGLRLVDLPFRHDMSGPNSFSDMLTSSTVTGQPWMTLIQSNDLKLFTVGVPTIWYSLLASFARSNWRWVYPCLFSAAVLIKLLAPSFFWSSFRPCWYAFGTKYWYS